MPYTDTPVKKLIVNVLTENQYENITNPSDSELYLITDDAAVSAGTGLSATVSNGTTTINHSNSTTAKTTQALYPITIDAQGHISSSGSAVTIQEDKLFKVTVQYNNGTYSSDKTFAEIYAAFNTGKFVYVVADGVGVTDNAVFVINRVRSDDINFVCLYDYTSAAQSSTDVDKIDGYQLSISDYDLWGLESFTISSLPNTLTSSDIGKAITVVAGINNTQKWALTEMSTNTIRRWSGS